MKTYHEFIAIEILKNYNIISVIGSVIGFVSICDMDVGRRESNLKVTCAKYGIEFIEGSVNETIDQTCSRLNELQRNGTYLVMTRKDVRYTGIIVRQV